MHNAWKQIVLMCSDTLIWWGMKLGMDYRSDDEVVVFKRCVETMRDATLRDPIPSQRNTERITKS